MFNLPFPEYNTLLVKLTFKGLDKTMMHVPHRADPITVELLTRLYTQLNFFLVDHVVLWFLFLFMFFLFAHKSQFMCNSCADDHQLKLVKRGHVMVQGSCLHVKFLWTKTRQSGGDPLVVPLVPIPGSILCPVLAYFRMLEVVPAPVTSPVFVLPPRRVLVYY